MTEPNLGPFFVISVRASLGAFDFEDDSNTAKVCQDEDEVVSFLFGRMRRHRNRNFSNVVLRNPLSWSGEFAHGAGLKSIMCPDAYDYDIEIRFRLMQKLQKAFDVEDLAIQERRAAREALDKIDATNRRRRQFEKLKLEFECPQN